MKMSKKAAFILKFKPVVFLNPNERMNFLF